MGVNIYIGMMMMMIEGRIRKVNNTTKTTIITTIKHSKLCYLLTKHVHYHFSLYFQCHNMGLFLPLIVSSSEKVKELRRA